MIWILFLAVGQGPVTSTEFETEMACKLAGKEITKDIGSNKSQFWCIRKNK